MGLQNSWLMESSKRGKPGSTHQRRAAQRAVVGSYLRKKPRFLQLQSPEVRSILKSSSGVEVSAGWMAQGNMRTRWDDAQLRLA